MGGGLREGGPLLRQAVNSRLAGGIPLNDGFCSQSVRHRRGGEKNRQITSNNRRKTDR